MSNSVDGYNYFLFDWDGTIAQTLDLWPDALDEVLRKRNYSLTRKQLIESTWGFVAYVTTHTDISTEEAAKAIKEASDIIAGRSISVELFPGAHETLRALKQGGKHLALITTSERRMIMSVLEKYNLTNTFETIITDDDIEKSERKPHPKTLQMALEQMGGTPDKAIMIGDRDKDIVAGQNAEVDTVLFCSEEHQKHYDFAKLMGHKPTFTIYNFADLAELVLGESNIKRYRTQTGL